MSKRVLLCDDEVHILRAAEIPFRRLGYEVQCASNGVEAWELIEQSPPDLLITDWQMPRMDGLALIAKCREYEPTKKLPILLLTGRMVDPARGELFERWGVLAILAKPFSFREVVRYVQQILEGNCDEAQVAAPGSDIPARFGGPVSPTASSGFLPF